MYEIWGLMYETGVALYSPAGTVGRGGVVPGTRAYPVNEVCAPRGAYAGSDGSDRSDLSDLSDGGENAWMRNGERRLLGLGMKDWRVGWGLGV